jgi:DNA polymerase-1
MILIDAFAVIHRAFHALPPFRAPDGTHVNAVYGFFSTFLKAVREIKPDYVVVAFDLPGPTLRHKTFEAYKAQRPEVPPELSDQIPLIKELVEAMGLPAVTQEGYEAEDLIATVIAKTPKTNLKFVIATGDQDTLQLIGKRVSIYFLRRGLTDVVLFDEEKIRQVYGISPQQIIDVKALKGDPSDNIPGIPGIGEKTAVELVKKHGSLESIFTNLAHLPQKLQNLLAGRKKQAILSRKLVTINSNVPADISLDQFLWSDSRLLKALPLLQDYNMQSLIKRVTQAPPPPKSDRMSLKPEQERLL